MKSEKTVIGRTALVSFPTEGIKGVPAKIDTGADSSSVWASNLHIDDDHTLHYTLFAAESPFYSGKTHTTKSYKVRLIRSSNGTTQVRYSVKLTVSIGGRKVRGSFTLADRSNNTYPVLIGNKLLYRKFLVDVAIGKIRSEKNKAKSNKLNSELLLDPKAFFEKYHTENHRGDISL